MRKTFTPTSLPGRFSKRKGIFHFSLSVFFLFLGALFPGFSLAGDGGQKNVLILHSYHPGLIWTDDIMSGMQEGFGKETDQIHLHVEYLDTQRYPDIQYFSNILSSIIHYKLQHRHFDLVLLSDNNALDFVLEHRNDLFSNTAIVFCGINNFRPSMIAGVENITGVAEIPSFLETIETALRLHPETTQVVVVGGVGNLSSLENRNMLVSLLEEHPVDPSVRFLFWDDLPNDELTSRLERLPDDSLVLVNGTLLGVSGEILPYPEGIRTLSGSSTRPIYSLWDFALGHGIVGGKLVRGKQQGRIAARMALRILKGEDPAHIPVTGAPNRFMFDFEQLEKFGLPVRSLPEGSVIINRPPPIYALSKGQLWAGLAILTGLSLLLSADILVRRQAQKRLREQKERVDLLLNSAAEAIYGIDLQGKCTFINPAALRMLGYRGAEDLLGKNIHELIHHTRPDGTPYPPEECRVCTAYRREENLHVEDEVFWRAEGSSFPVEYWSYPIRKGGRTVGAVVTFLDISERKEAAVKVDRQP
jgi:PAS domain S-box-containing protein